MNTWSSETIFKTFTCLNIKYTEKHRETYLDKFYSLPTEERGGGGGNKLAIKSDK